MRAPPVADAPAPAAPPAAAPTKTSSPRSANGPAPTATRSPTAAASAPPSKRPTTPSTERTHYPRCGPPSQAVGGFTVLQEPVQRHRVQRRRSTASPRIMSDAIHDRGARGPRPTPPARARWVGSTIWCWSLHNGGAVRWGSWSRDGGLKVPHRQVSESRVAVDARNPNRETNPGARCHPVRNDTPARTAGPTAAASSNACHVSHVPRPRRCHRRSTPRRDTTTADTGNRSTLGDLSEVNGRQPAPGTNPAGSSQPPALSGDLDCHTPFRRDLVQPQPVIHHGITAAEVRPVMPARIDPLDPDSTHQPAVFQPARSRIEPCFRPARPAKRLAEKRPTTRRATGAFGAAVRRPERARSRVVLTPPRVEMVASTRVAVEGSEPEPVEEPVQEPVAGTGNSAAASSSTEYDRGSVRLPPGPGRAVERGDLVRGQAERERRGVVGGLAAVLGPGMGRTVSFSISQRSATCAGLLPYRSPISSQQRRDRLHAVRSRPRNGCRSAAGHDGRLVRRRTCR